MNIPQHRDVLGRDQRRVLDFSHKRVRPGSAGLDYDYVFVGTKKVTPPAKTSDFLKIMLDGSACSWVSAMPETQDADAVVIDVTKNRIYLSGEMA